ncbi:MAG: CesT family type III secretion system chaperone [Burkholderiaceae bacterium]
MRNKFEALVTGFCKLKNLDNPRQYIDGGPINVNDTKCKLIYDEKNSPDRLFLYVVFGYAPPEKEAVVFATLLRQNHVGFEGRGPGFCISAKTGKIGYVVSISLGDARPDQLASSMVYYANKAAEWRETFFLKSGSNDVLSRSRFHQ